MNNERTLPVLYLVIPCYNEEEVLPETTKRLTEKLHRSFTVTAASSTSMTAAATKPGHSFPNTAPLSPMWTA